MPPLLHPPPSVARARSLVGRETEWECLHQWYTTARQGVRQVGFIAGEAGIGKTSLVEAFVSHVRPQRPCSWAMDSASSTTGLGKRIFRSWKRSAVSAVARTGPIWWISCALMPRAGSSTSRRFCRQTSMQALFRAAHQSHARHACSENWPKCSRCFTAQHPLILVLEDLHWSDTATLEWLAYIARRRDPARLLVLGTYRPFRGHCPSAPAAARWLPNSGSSPSVRSWSSTICLQRTSRRICGSAVGA